jgi:two-component sensor histidine kinase/CHASE3 domain sensor protein
VTRPAEAGELTEVAHPTSSSSHNRELTNNHELRRASLSGNRILLASVVLSFAMLVASVLLVYEISRESEAAEAAVIHTLKVKQSAATLLNLIASSESGQRGYLLTGDESLLAPYRTARQSFDQQLGALRLLVADDPDQLRRIDELTPVLVERLGAIEQTMRYAAAGRQSDAARVVTQQGAPLMRDIRARFEAFDEAEDALLLARQHSATEVRTKFTLAVGAMLAICVMLAIVSLMSVRRYLISIDESRRRLATYNRELERRVRERTEELAKAAELANRERVRAETLLTDVNHRVGNNLALVSSFLTMQQRVATSPDAIRALGAARARVQAIASAHRKLRLGADFATVRANEVIEAVVDDIAAGLASGDSIQIEKSVAPLEIAARDAVTLGVLTSELVMNAIKHAFSPGDVGRIRVVLSWGAGAPSPVLEVSDDGVGWHTKNTGDEAGLGARIVEMIARQFGSTPERGAVSDDARRPGTRVSIRLNKLQLAQ